MLSPRKADRGARCYTQTMTYERTPPADPRLPWVLVANGSRARLFERDPENGAMRELSGYVHPTSRMKAADLGRDRPGQAMKGVAHTQYQPHTPIDERELHAFAQQLAGELEAAVQDNRLRRWSLIASNPFLGRLRATLAPGAAARLDRHVERDVTSFVGSDLEARVSALLAIEAAA